MGGRPKLGHDQECVFSRSKALRLIPQGGVYRQTEPQPQRRPGSWSWLCVTLDKSLPISGLQFPCLSEGEGWEDRSGSSCSAAVDSGIVSELRALNEFCCMFLGTSRVPDLGGAYTEAWKPTLPRR